MGKKRILLSWSSGKDSAWALHELRQDPTLQVCGLITTVNATHGRVAMHALVAELRPSEKLFPLVRRLLAAADAALVREVRW